MPVRVRAIGEELSLMRIGRRQLKVRGPRKKDKPLMVFKTKSVPSHTEYWLEAALTFAKAGREMRGRTFEEVIMNVIEKCSGQHYVPESVKRARKEARYKQADANIERLERELAAKRGATVGELRYTEMGF